MFHNSNLFGSCIIHILFIYSTNIGTEYIKHGIYSPFFPSKCSLFHNSNVFGSCIIHINIQGVLNLNKFLRQKVKEMDGEQACTQLRIHGPRSIGGVEV